ncbi:hypothetical protein [Cohnella mopanensis]|uniref:hypothetical protein n=1 Tax=Cohnella mopanensis TaxID=2911966 RepID=UPI001EF7F769|nr:hypothetical protein [Cohnella mopanensis]
MNPTLSADLERILKKLGNSDLVSKLVNEISGSDLNTLLLKVFNERSKLMSPSELLNRYKENRFVQPAMADVLQLKQLELDILKIALNHRASPLQLSPVAPLGCTSVVGKVDQNKVISSLRGTEVVSDATNLMALHISELIQTKKNSREDFIRICTTHRHIRAQFFGNAPGMLPHFHLFCTVTSGIDQGAYSFEKESFWEQIRMYQSIFKTLFGSDIEIIFSEREGYKDSAGLLSRVINHGNEFDIAISISTSNKENQYYKGFQFTIKTVINGIEHYIGDGGFVDWTQKLLGNKKERLLISAIGLDRLLLGLGVDSESKREKYKGEFPDESSIRRNYSIVE